MARAHGRATRGETALSALLPPVTWPACPSLKMNSADRLHCSRKELRTHRTYAYTSTPS
jgi:hypothetical protein